MKKVSLFIILLVSCIAFAQDITGKWNGQLTLPQGQLPLVINISKNNNVYSATMDSPLQGAKDIPMATATFQNNELHLTMPAANLDYTATYSNGEFKGTWKQNGNILKFDLKRGETKVNRPQEPLPPFPYDAEEVTFKNEKAGINLAGTLTLPSKEGSFPVVILITGSGGQNRNEEILGHKPFLVIADHLTRNGIGVLRFDDRGVAKSGGNFEGATTADFVTDAQAAFNYLKTRKEVNKKKIGIAGHSEGGTVATIVAATNPDIAFVVLLAGSNIPGDELMVLQNYMIGKAQGMPEEDLAKLSVINRKLYNVLKTEDNPANREKSLLQLFNSEMKPIFVSKGVPADKVDDIINNQIQGLTDKWYVSFIRSNPTPHLEKIKCPVLAINGDKDVQVAAQANLDAVSRAAAKSGNKKVTVKQMPGLNHLLQEAETGLPDEYGSIEQTIAPVVLKEITTWILAQVK